MTLRPIGDKVVVELLASEETSPGGIILPDTAKKKPQEGKIVAVGPGRLQDDGKRSALTVEVGQTVIFSKYGGSDVTIDGKDYKILDEADIYAIKA